MACHSIDGEHNSLQNNYTMSPIGYLSSCFKTKNGTPRQPSVCGFARARLKIEKSVFQRPDHSLEGLQMFSHVWIIYIFHQNGNKAFTKAKVKPPRLNGQKTGVFACRSPYRPNPVGLTLARLDSVTGDTLHLSGVDIIDGTPVLDIKPYIPEYDSVSGSPDLIPERRIGIDVLKSERSGDKQLTSHNSASSSPCHNKDLPEDGLLMEDFHHEYSLSQSILKPSSQGQETPIASNRSSSDVEMSNYCKGSTAVETDQQDTPQGNECQTHSWTEVDVDSDVSVKGQSATEAVECKVPLPNKIATTVDVKVGDWVKSPPIAHLKVRFTPGAVDDLERFHGVTSSQGSNRDKFSMEFFKDPSELREAIISILSADPRSTYRRNSCSDRLYFFPIDNVHVTSWFNNDVAEVLRLQPLCDAEIPNK